AMKQIISTQSAQYPIFIGFVSAKDLLQIAEAPAFDNTTTHEDIATNILKPPIKDWQRPIELSRVNQIAAVYNNPNEFMPNPVLLSENGLTAPSHSITPLLAGGQITHTWEIDIPIPGIGQPKPLWILDGQHRIRGLAQSTQVS